MKRIPLSGARGKGKCAIVDNEDYEYISSFNWHLHAGGYAIRMRKKIDGKGGKWIFMHRVINKTPEGAITDHINRNTLDNRKCNLRTCDGHINNINKSEQSNNKSGYKGVWWCEDALKWRAYIRCHGKLIHLGHYEIMSDAISARKKAEKIYHII